MDNVKVDLIPEFDTFVEVWVALFGRAESEVVASLCSQFWSSDFERPARRAILDATRARFPVHFKPFVRVLRALSGSGFSRSDPLATFGGQSTDPSYEQHRRACIQQVAHYFDSLPTFTQVVPLGAVSGSHALYERLPERYGSSTSPTLTYINLRPVTLPGRSVLPLRSQGVLMSPDGEEFIVVNWRHTHSGWKLLLDVLIDYNRRRRLLPAVAPALSNLPLRGRSHVEPIALELSDVGMDVLADGDPSLVADALDLLGAMSEINAVWDNVMSAVQEASGRGKPGLAEQTMLVLEDALSISATQLRDRSKTSLVASCLNTLAALLATTWVNNVWLITRASSTFFESSRTGASAATILAADRATGTYATTHTLLMFVHRLFAQASSETLSSTAKVQQVRTEVLLRALRFVHAEVWVEHGGWKYARLGDRFRVGGAVSALYGDILEQHPTGAGGPLGALSQAVYDAFVTKAAASSVGPLVGALTTFPAVRRRRGLRLDDLRSKYFLLQGHLRVLRLALTFKQRLHGDQGVCLLEQALCTRAGLGVSITGRGQDAPLDVLIALSEDTLSDAIISLSAVRVLSALCSTLALSHPQAPTILGHLSNPEGSVAVLVRVGRDPYLDHDLRVAVWRFMALAVEKEPALGNLFITGRLRTTIDGGLALPNGVRKPKSQQTALEVAREMLEGWRSLWDVNQELLAGLLGFVCAVWERGFEHRAALEPLRADGAFWDDIVAIVKEDLLPTPECRSEAYADEPGLEPRSALHDGVQAHADLVLSKAFAARIVAFDLALDRHGRQSDAPASRAKPRSFVVLERVFVTDDALRGLIGNAIASAYDPVMYDRFSELVREHCPELVLDRLESTVLPSDRSFGDAFAFAPSTLRLWTERVADNDEQARNAEALMHALYSINLNLSLTHAARELGGSWRALLVEVSPFLQGESQPRAKMLSLAATVAFITADEQRPGDLMAAVHDIRLSVLLALLELVWFFNSDAKAAVAPFVQLLDAVRNTITSEAHPPLRSVRGFAKPPFHRTLLQVVYFCLRQSRNLLAQKGLLTASDRLAMFALVDTTQAFVIDALRFVFDTALERLDPDLDADMELLTAVFHECTRTDLSPSSTLWLARCKESDVVRASLDIYVRADLTGLSSLVFSRRKQPLYAPHILAFHTTFATHTASAERLAAEGILVAYSRAHTGGDLIDTTTADLPGERNPAHMAYCTMLAVFAAVVSALGMQKHYFDDEAYGFVRLHNAQIARALSWTVNESLSLPLLEEMERVADLFYALAKSAATSASRRPHGTADVMLDAFSRGALRLLQQLNYAVAHPNQLAKALEPATAEERDALERDTADTAAGGAAGAVVDPVRRPFLAGVVHRLYGLAGNLVCALIVVSQAEDVLRAEAQDLPTQHAVVAPVRVSLPSRSRPSIADHRRAAFEGCARRTSVGGHAT
jgi:nuclear pore complex protein Nup188